jgi:hypothetical protein
MPRVLLTLAAAMTGLRCHCYATVFSKPDAIQGGPDEDQAYF